MKGSAFVFNYVQLFYYKFHRVNFKPGGSYIDFPDWIKNKKTTINPVNKKDKCFQYNVTAAFNHWEIKKDLQERITKFKPFIKKCNLEGINFPSEKDDWKKFEKNDIIITLNVLYAKKGKICHAYVLKYNWNREKQVILLMISKGEKLCKAESDGWWYYLAGENYQHY